MKKILFLFIAFLSTWQNYSQQVLKKKTETGNYYIIELFVFRNGADPCITDGSNDFTSIVDDALGVTYYLEDENANITALSYENTNNYFLPLYNEYLGNITYNYSGVFSNNTSDLINIGIPIYQEETVIDFDIVTNATTITTHGRAKNINNTSTSLLYISTSIPKLDNNGNPLPNNLWISVNSEYGYFTDTPYDPNTEDDVIAGEWWAKFNGTTWIEQTKDCYDNPIDYIPFICNSLNVEELEFIEKTFFITPNPANHKVFVNNIRGENFYRIFDLRGKNLKEGKLNADKSINIGELSEGVYFLKIRGKQPIRFIKKNI